MGLWIGAALFSVACFLWTHPHRAALRLAAATLRAEPWLWTSVSAILFAGRVEALLREGGSAPFLSEPFAPAPEQPEFWGRTLLDAIPSAVELFIVPWSAAPAACLLLILGMLGWRRLPLAAWGGAETLGRRAVLVIIPVLGLAFLLTRALPLLGLGERFLGLPGHLLQLAGRGFEFLAALLLLSWAFLSLARVLERDPLARTLDPLILATRRIAFLLPLALLLVVLENLPAWTGTAHLLPWWRAVAWLEAILFAPLVYLLTFLEPRPALLRAASTALHSQFKSLDWFVWYLVLALVLLLPLPPLELLVSGLSLPIRIPALATFCLFEAALKFWLLATWFVLMQGREFRAVGHDSPAATLS